MTRRTLCGIALAIVFADVSVGSAKADSPILSRIQPPSHIEGLWVWQPRFISDLAKQDEMLAFCERQGFNRLLVQIPWQSGSAQTVHNHEPAPPGEPAAGEATHPKIAFAMEFARLISEAARRHIAVEALDGTPYMGDKIHQPESLATVDSIVAFDHSLSGDAKLAGIHWDIEPYVRDDWKVMATRPPIEMDYLQLLTDTKKKLHDSDPNMTLAVDIPMWYDNKVDPDDNCIIPFNGQTKNLQQHVQDITDYVGIMSYRQHAVGKNSAFEQVSNELAYAEKIGKFICPAYETIELKDTPQITFFGKSADTLISERRSLEEALKDRPGFGGMFIHNYPSICTILEPNGPQK